VFDLLEDEYIKIGKPSPWNDGTGRVSFWIQFRYSVELRMNFESQFDTWCSRHLSNPHKIMFDFNQGDPFFTLIIQENDLTMFLLRFSRVIY
jgi:hypothetical protein